MRTLLDLWKFLIAVRLIEDIIVLLLGNSHYLLALSLLGRRGKQSFALFLLAYFHGIVQATRHLALRIFLIIDVYVELQLILLFL
jgi:hypothetical protein